MRHADHRSNPRPVAVQSIRTIRCSRGISPATRLFWGWAAGVGDGRGDAPVHVAGDARTITGVKRVKFLRPLGPSEAFDASCLPQRVGALHTE